MTSPRTQRAPCTQVEAPRPIGRQRSRPGGHPPGRRFHLDHGGAMPAATATRTCRTRPSSRTCNAASTVAAWAGPSARTGYHTCVQALVSPGCRKEKSGWLSCRPRPSAPCREHTRRPRPDRSDCGPRRIQIHDFPTSRPSCPARCGGWPHGPAPRRPHDRSPRRNRPTTPPPCRTFGTGMFAYQDRSSGRLAGMPPLCRRPSPPLPVHGRAARGRSAAGTPERPRRA